MVLFQLVGHRPSAAAVAAAACLQLVDVPLLPGGDNKRVTDRNKKEFVLMATRRRCLGGAESAISSMRSGMADVIPKNLLSVLLPSEVSVSISSCWGCVALR